MASELPTGALSNLASSVKNIVTGQTADADAHTKVQATQVEAKVAAPAAKKVDTTVEAHHDGTTVHKEKASAVEHETVKSHEHEKVDTVIDKEIHQDHYHTTIQPVKDKNVLPTQHIYQDNEEEREIDHRNNAAKKEAAREAASIHDEKDVKATTHSKEVAPTQEGQHIHHHIHETIQPVIEKETIQRQVVHTTNHIHETEHLNDEHHGATVAPAITMAEFEKGKGGATGAAVTEGVLKEEKPKVKSSASVSKEVSMTDFENGVAKEESRKREAPTGDVDIEAATKVGKIDATEAHNPLSQ
ncbi:hypothetical protein TruAng_008801 [Truncatella angustata]|nr:hypothetical protein TruAng_008801 [Truncatella angustata]